MDKVATARAEKGVNGINLRTVTNIEVRPHEFGEES